VNGFRALGRSDYLNDSTSNPAPAPEMILVDAVSLHLVQGQLDDAWCVSPVLLHHPSRHYPGIAIHGAGYDKDGYRPVNAPIPKTLSEPERKPPQEHRLPVISLAAE
jgi:hypothetical protein